MPRLIFACVCAGILAVGCGCATVGSRSGGPTYRLEDPPVSPAMAAEDSVVYVYPEHAPPTALERELRIVRARTNTIEDAVWVGAAGMALAGVVGYLNLPDGTDNQHALPWIALAAGGAIAFIAVVVP